MKKIERKHASRRLLLKINRVSEELDIVLEVLKQQKTTLEEYHLFLDPVSFKNASMARKTRFPYERKAIERITKAVGDRIANCEELRERLTRLAKQNVQLVETQQDDNNRVIVVFTIVTIIFLPASFVTGYFGMNINGINGHSTGLFWGIAVGATLFVMGCCGLLAYWTPLRHNTAKLLRDKQKIE